MVGWGECRKWETTGVWGGGWGWGVGGEGRSWRSHGGECTKWRS